MFSNNTEPSDLDKAISRTLEHMTYFQPEAPEYAQICDQLTKLHALKTIESNSGVSTEVIAQITGSLAGILLIIGHERAHVIATKALGFVMKLK